MENILYNLYFEKSILSSVIFEPKIFEKVQGKLSTNDFYFPEHQDIFEAMITLYKIEKPIDEEFLKVELIKQGKFSEQVLLDILIRNPISNIESYIIEVKEKSLSRQTLALSNRLKSLVFDQSCSNEDIINTLIDYIDKKSKSLASLLPNSFDDLLVQMQDKKLLSIPKDLKSINGTHDFFYNGGLHVVHGLSKSGKTYFVLKTLNYAKNVRTIWIDGDNNDKKMINRFENIIHLAPINPDSYLNKWLNVSIDYKDIVFVIDSLKDFKNNQDLDTNDGMDIILKRFKKLTKLGATVIVIHHSTIKYNLGGKPNGIKIKGNEEALYSNSDMTYLYERDLQTNESKLTCERSRNDDVLNAKVFKTDLCGNWLHNVDHITTKRDTIARYTDIK